MRFCGVIVIALLTVGSFGLAQTGPTDLDTFMQQVLARRDDNWKRLQQYILDEEERSEVRGPSGTLVWGQKHEYSWYVREGYFVRSPVRFNGTAVSEADRQKYEDAFLKRAKQRDEQTGGRATPPPSSPAPSDVQNVLAQNRDPQFISSAYFLRFKFEPGRYALVGHDAIDGRDALKIEYYPSHMFSDDPNTRTERRVRQAAVKSSDNRQFEEESARLFNKTSFVTLWVDPAQFQILKFTFDNAGLDFLPAAWLARVTDLRAGMTMSEAFPGIWLPKQVDTTGTILSAIGRLDIRYELNYSNYREASVTTKVRTGAER
jgi:hypothetical protein